jgi:hypothetical protein
VALTDAQPLSDTFLSLLTSTRGAEGRRRPYRGAGGEHAEVPGHERLAQEGPRQPRIPHIHC